MSLRETVRQWDAEGKLDAEFVQLRTILMQRNHTAQQIQFCFETLLPVLALFAPRETGELTLDAFKASLAKWLKDSVSVIEKCEGIIDSQARPEREILQDIMRIAQNKLWQRQAEETEDGGEK